MADSRLGRLRRLLRPSALGRWILVVGGIGMLGACQVKASSEVAVRPDGTGTVRVGVGIDEEAVGRVGDLSGQLRVEDLRQSGWSVTGPRKEDDGLTWVRASKPFANPGQATRVLGEVSGPQGPFRDMRLSQQRSFFHTRTGFTATVDLTGGLSAFADPDLQQRLGGGLGLDLEALRRRFGSGLADAFRVEVVARLPGSIDSNGFSVDGGAKWVVTPGESIRLQADAEKFNLVPWLPALIALAAAGAAVAIVLVRRRR